MFEPVVGTEFIVDLGGAGRVALTLASCERLSAGGLGPRREPFSLVFHGPAVPVLTQATYAMDHPELGRLDIFIVPIQPNPGGAPRYEAVFN
ncbi:MAG: hypothetical protein JWL72_3369 [Ilumatobacteraceae bacterium]|nr:hypothetical protein [Ilumatobacteraceae bacterium]